MEDGGMFFILHLLIALLDQALKITSTAKKVAIRYVCEAYSWDQRNPFAADEHEEKM